MIIHIAREGRSMGRFTVEEVAEGLRDGRILPTDLAWHEELTGWIPVSELGGLPEVGPAEASVPAPVLPLEPAWERRVEIGFVAAMIESVSGLITHPTRVFAAMEPEGSRRTALWFLMILGTASTWIAMGFQYAVYKVNPEAFGEQMKEIPPGLFEALFGGMVVLTPLWVAVSAVVLAGIIFGFLGMVSAGKITFRGVFRVYCYAWGAASVIQALPVCGGYLYPVVGMWLSVVGLRQALRVPLGLAIVAVLLPALLCCGAFFGMLVFAFGASAAS